MTKALTSDQLKFLNGLLGVRAQQKSPLKGRQLNKIKDQLADYERRRRKTIEALDALEDAHGAEAARFMRQQLDVGSGIVDAGARTGDETVFKIAYERLESVKDDARAALKRLDDAARQVESASEKFEKALDAALSATPPKQAGSARKVVEACSKWLSEHEGVLAPRIVATMEAAQAASGTALSAAESLALSTQLGTETAKLCDAIAGRPGGVPDAGDAKAVADMLVRLEKGLKGARASGSVVGINVLTVALARLRRTELLVAPPSLDREEPKEGGSGEGGSEEGGSGEDGALGRSGRLMNADIEELSGEEQAERVLAKSETLARQGRAELDRVAEAVAAARTEFDALEKDVGGAAALAEEIALIEASLATAEAHVRDAGTALDDAESVTKADAKGKAKLEDIQDAMEEAAANCDAALALVAAADKSLGRAEGGLVYVRNKADAANTLKQRLDKIDQDHVAAVLANIAVLSNCNVAKDIGDAELLKHLVIVSADADGSQAIVGGITDKASYDRQVTALMATPKLGTQLVTQLMSDCQAIVNDCERYVGTLEFRSALGAGVEMYNQVAELAKTDATRFTVPVVPRKAGDTGALLPVGVAVVGGGPIGLLAAVEARLAGGSPVNVFEGRNDAYSRLNVLKLDDAAVKRMAAAGIVEQVLPDRNKREAAVKDIEEALERRCGALGIKLDRGKFLLDVKRDDRGVVELTFKGDDKRYTCDILIVATGGSVASAQKHADNVVLGDKLGIPFQKAAVKDYAAVGLFKTTAEKVDANKAPGWQYGFETKEVQYVVSQLTEEEFRDLSENPRKLVERIQGTRKGQTQTMTAPVADPLRDVAGIGPGDELAASVDTGWDALLVGFGGINNFYGRDKAADAKSIAKCKAGAIQQLGRTIEGRVKAGKEGKVSPADVEKALMNFLLAEFGVSRFPIELQQASSFGSADGAAVLVGDSAATPHPSTAKGLNTGVAEMGAMRDLIQDLQRTGGDEAKRKEALQVYDFEVKRRTDIMINEGFGALQTGVKMQLDRIHTQRITPLMRSWGNGGVLANRWKTELGTAIDGLRVPVEGVKDDPDWSMREQAVKDLRLLLTKLETAAKTFETRAPVLAQDVAVPKETVPAELLKLLTDVVPLP